MKVVVASTNRGKLVEVQRHLGQLAIQAVSMEEAGMASVRDLPEEGTTFAENALSKARALAEMVPPGFWCLADDSGLEVDALDGAPGVYSARWAGVEERGSQRDEANNRKLLAALEQVADEDRSARFVCCLALVGPAGQRLTATGSCEGRILRSARGSGGFGYDPLFLPDGLDRSMAELSLDEKNRISHRGQALRALADRIRSS